MRPITVSVWTQVELDGFAAVIRLATASPARAGSPRRRGVAVGRLEVAGELPAPVVYAAQHRQCSRRGRARAAITTRRFVMPRLRSSCCGSLGPSGATEVEPHAGDRGACQVGCAEQFERLAHDARRLGGGSVDRYRAVGPHDGQPAEWRRLRQQRAGQVFPCDLGSRGGLSARESLHGLAAGRAPAGRWQGTGRAQTGFPV